MTIDNRDLILSKLKNNKASFSYTTFGGRVYCIANNRAARRYLKSNTMKTLMIENDLEGNEEPVAVG